MKKTIIMALAILFACSIAFASAGESDNYQKIYSVSDPVYGYVRDLYVLEGYGLPSTTGPWSGSELLMMLRVFEGKTLEGASKNLYDTVMQILDADAAKSSFDAGLEINEELFINTNSSSPYFQGRDNWIRGWANEKPFLNVNTEEHIGENFYGFFDLSLGVAKDWKSGDSTAHTFGDSLLWSNTPFLFANDMKQLDFNMPLRAFVADRKSVV